ncbi:MAG TPA: AAA family ATPase [Myxococcota bacterium]|nr:AAA family ATPase [Myxococcota bacterium]
MSVKPNRPQSVTSSRLVSIEVERFKSFEAKTLLELKPLTVILGRNNSGKSTLIQSLLLLKQTLAEPRPEVPLHLEGFVNAFNLRELTFGWPQNGAGAPLVPGPSFALTWETNIDPRPHLEAAGEPDRANLAKLSGLQDLDPKNWDEPGWPTWTTLRLETAEVAGTIALKSIELKTEFVHSEATLTLTRSADRWSCAWNGQAAPRITVELDHFIPYLQVDRAKLGPRDKQRAFYNAYLAVMAPALEALKMLLGQVQYLGSTRSTPPSLYRASNVAPQELGASGELAAQLLHRRREDLVHYLPSLELSAGGVTVPRRIRERKLVDAVNDTLVALSIDTALSVQDIHEVGFRLLFGEASIAHVGRGLTYLLPLIELGLFADPLRFTAVGDDLSLEAYSDRCPSTTHLALEEPEAHLHPKVQSRLAHWLVSLAMSNRQVTVETHSDHLVRRLRGLIARAGRGSYLEKWLRDNVSIVEVDQDESGCSTITNTRLTADGGLEARWPKDFMDEASDEDDAIYYARLSKSPPPDSEPEPLIIHDDGPEPEPEGD